MGIYLLLGSAIRVGATPQVRNFWKYAFKMTHFGKIAELFDVRKCYKTSTLEHSIF
mgnify:CR=1 FL=1